MIALCSLTVAVCVQAVDGEWDIPRLTKDACDLKGKTVGTVAAGRIGCHVIKRLKVARPCCMQLVLDSHFAVQTQCRHCSDTTRENRPVHNQSYLPA